MELTPTQLKAARSLLMLVRDQIEDIRKKPFRDHTNSFPTDGSTPEEAGKRVVSGRNKIFAGAGVAVVVLVVAIYLWIGTNLHVPSWLSFISPLSRVVRLSVVLPVAALILISVIALLLNFFPKTPVHDPDPLFARLLRAKVKSETPISGEVIADLLADRRFREIFERAVELNLPTNQDEPTVNRLLDMLKDDSLFLQLYADRYSTREEFGNQASTDASGEKQQEKIDHAVTEYFYYATRKLLFEAILGDPDFLYLYDDIVHRRRKIARWLSKIRWEKAKDLFSKPKKESARKGTEGVGYTASAANLIVLLVAVVIAFFARPGTGGSVSDQHRDDKCEGEIAEVRTLIAKLPVSVPQPAPAPPVHFTVQSALPPITFSPEVKAPAITFPPFALNIPPKSSGQFLIPHASLALFHAEVCT